MGTKRSGYFPVIAAMYSFYFNEKIKIKTITQNYEQLLQQINRLSTRLVA